MSPGTRKLALTAHVVVSVGWLGAVIAFLPIAIVGSTSQDPDAVRGAFVAMEVIGWYALVPLAGASLLTGLVQALGTRWGLLRHYWVLFKFLITVVSTIILLAYMQTLGFLAGEARDMAAPAVIPDVLRSFTAVMHAGVALLALLVATTLSVYKPQGVTPYGRARQHEPPRGRPAGDSSATDAIGDREPGSGAGILRGTAADTPRWVKVFGIVALLLLLMVLHFVLGGGGRHGPNRHAAPLAPLAVAGPPCSDLRAAPQVRPAAAWRAAHDGAPA